MKYLGIDYGSRTIGLSVSDEQGSIAFPKGVIANDSLAVSHIVKIVDNEHISAIVVGDARTISGGANTVTHERDEFVKQLSSVVPTPVERVYESWSSQEAGRYAPKRDAHNDAAAAAIILQRYLDMYTKKKNSV